MVRSEGQMGWALDAQQEDVTGSRYAEQADADEEEGSLKMAVEL